MRTNELKQRITLVMALAVLSACGAKPTTPAEAIGCGDMVVNLISQVQNVDSPNPVYRIALTACRFKMTELHTGCVIRGSHDLPKETAGTFTATVDSTSAACSPSIPKTLNCSYDAHDEYHPSYRCDDIQLNDTFSFEGSPYKGTL